MNQQWHDCLYLFQTIFIIRCRKSKQKVTTNNTPKAKFINAKGVSNNSYASEATIDIIRGNQERNLKETEYYLVEANGSTGKHDNKGKRNEQAKPENSPGYDLSRPQMKTDEDSKDYDHLEHFGLNQRPRDDHDSNDTYAHAHTESFDGNDTYSHSQSLKFSQTGLCTRTLNGQTDDTYDHAKNVGYGDSNTYDHSRVSVRAGYADYAYAHAHNSFVKENDYDHAVCDDVNYTYK